MEMVTDSYSDLVQAIILDNVTYFGRLLCSSTYDIDAEIPFRCFPLTGSKDELKVLMRTPLMIAAMTNSPKVVEYIVGNFRANVVRVSTSDGATAIDCANNSDCSTIVEMLKDARIGNGPPSTASYDQSSSDQRRRSVSTQSLQGRQEMDIWTPFCARGAICRPLSFNNQVNWNMNHRMQGRQGPPISNNQVYRQEPNIQRPFYGRGAVGVQPLFSINQVYENMSRSMQGWQEPNIQRPFYARQAVGVWPLSSTNQVYQNMNSSMQGRQELNMITSFDARDAAGEMPSSSDDQVHQNMNRSTQERQELNMTTSFDARDASGEMPSSSDDQAHQKMNCSMQERQELNMTTSFDARDAAGEMPSSSDDQVHQNMNRSMQERQELNIPAPDDVRDAADEMASSSIDQNTNRSMQERQELNIPTPDDVRDAAGEMASSSIDQNTNRSMPGTQEPNMPTPSDARDLAGEMPLNSKDQVNQDMDYGMQGRQEPEVTINSSTPATEIMNLYWPPLTEEGKLIQLPRRR
ncbi:hypothetical protein PVK06_003746 [Gossypium arboreum]|uniref:Uncharacterized protein n=1 Tax=Gossypium arboreum TaxID=29729 RepID=A0ABR0QQ45_GOSAR|nr:hypothetical protein PVK06_003746 [Gossypium arboreum]